MTPTLVNDDCLAIDLLMDGTLTTAGNPSPESIKSRIKAAKRLLQLLQWLPTADPPADLTARTLHRVDQAILATIAQPSDATRPTL